MNILSAYYIHARCLQRPEECVTSLRTRVMVDCELPSGYQKLNPGTVEEQPVRFTAEPRVSSF